MTVKTVDEELELLAKECDGCADAKRRDAPGDANAWDTIARRIRHLAKRIRG
jgi:hypothetical protein